MKTSQSPVRNTVALLDTNTNLVRFAYPFEHELTRYFSNLSKRHPEIDVLFNVPGNYYLTISRRFAKIDKTWYSIPETDIANFKNQILEAREKGCNLDTLNYTRPEVTSTINNITTFRITTKKGAFIDIKVDADLYHLLLDDKWYYANTSPNAGNKFYVCTNYCRSLPENPKRTVYLHQFIWSKITGNPITWGKELQIDHINGDTTDYTRSNLRQVSQSVNAVNIPQTHSKYVGVSRITAKRKKGDYFLYSAAIPQYLSKNGHRTIIGSKYKSEIEAAEAIRKFTKSKELLIRPVRQFS